MLSNIGLLMMRIQCNGLCETGSGSIYVLVVDVAQHIIAVNGNAAQNQKNDGFFNGLNGNTVCLCDLNLLLEEFVHPDKGVDTASNDTENNSGNKFADLLNGGFFRHLVAVCSHDKEQIECVNAASNHAENQSSDPIEFFHNNVSFPRIRV